LQNDTDTLRNEMRGGFGRVERILGTLETRVLQMANCRR